MNKVKLWWASQESGLRKTIIVLSIFAVVGVVVWIRTKNREWGYTWRSDGVSMLVWIVICIALIGFGIYMNKRNKGK